MAATSRQDIPSLDSFLYLIPKGHDKALRQAFYNTAATLFALFMCAAAVAVYYVLEAFLKPLLWATLCGAFLHPFKHSLTVYVTKWLNSVYKTDAPFLLSVVTLPFNTINQLADSFTHFFFAKIKLIAGITVSLVVASILNNFLPIEEVLNGVVTFWSYSNQSMEYFQSIWVCFLQLNS